MYFTLTAKPINDIKDWIWTRYIDKLFIYLIKGDKLVLKLNRIGTPLQTFDYFFAKIDNRSVKLFIIYQKTYQNGLKIFDSHKLRTYVFSCDNNYPNLKLLISNLNNILKNSSNSSKKTVLEVYSKRNYIIFDCKYKFTGIMID